MENTAWVRRQLLLQRRRRLEEGIAGWQMFVARRARLQARALCLNEAPNGGGALADVEGAVCRSALARDRAVLVMRIRARARAYGCDGVRTQAARPRDHTRERAHANTHKKSPAEAGLFRLARSCDQDRPDQKRYCAEMPNRLALPSNGPDRL